MCYYYHHRHHHHHHHQTRSVKCFELIQRNLRNKCNRNVIHKCSIFVSTLSFNFFLIFCFCFSCFLHVFILFHLWFIFFVFLLPFYILVFINRVSCFFLYWVSFYTVSSSFPYLFSAFSLSLQFSCVCILCSCAGGQCDSVDSQCTAHGAHLHVRQYCGTWAHIVQHPVARERTYQRSDRFHPLLLHPGVRHSPCAHLCVLPPRDTQIENCGAQEQVKREEEVTPQSHQIGTYSHSCVCLMLAALLDHSGAYNFHKDLISP